MLGYGNWIEWLLLVDHFAGVVRDVGRCQERGHVGHVVRFAKTIVQLLLALCFDQFLTDGVVQLHRIVHDGPIPQSPAPFTVQPINFLIRLSDGAFIGGGIHHLSNVPSGTVELVQLGIGDV